MTKTLKLLVVTLGALIVTCAAGAAIAWSCSGGGGEGEEEAAKLDVVMASTANVGSGFAIEVHNTSMFSITVNHEGLSDPTVVEFEGVGTCVRSFSSTLNTNCRGAKCIKKGTSTYTVTATGVTMASATIKCD